MAIHRSSKLFEWKIGNKSLTDIFLGHDSYEDIIYHNRKFYALDYMGKTLSVDSRSFEVIRVTYMDSIIPAGRHHFVKSCEDLFLIFRCWAYEDSRIYFEAFKLDEERNQWVPAVHELEHRALFVGEDCSFAVSAKEFRGCKGNCIYFKSNSFSKGVNEDYPGACAGIFNFKDNTVGRLAVFPGYSEIFWPVPSWLNFHAASTSTHAPH
ncbi:F-box protein SKIP23-like [Pistacia vera]|uniref:F-box protein SKIP23-like n=1 Tax=Pistacia vera TaxID=55513 RepID=UPI0012638236|nr:F-box protein SKIP23-like [Pistacia vera]